MILHEWIAFYSAILNIHRSGVLTALAWLVPQESAARESQSRRVLCTPYNYAPCHFMQSHICKVYACLAVTCHLRFWQDDQGLLHATAVTRGWNGYRNKSQHRKLTLENKILLPLQQGFEPATFRSWVRCSNHWAIPARKILLCSLYVLFRDFSCAFCPSTVASVTICVVVWGLFSLQKCLVFFLLSDVSSCQLFVLVVLFVCLQWHAVGKKLRSPMLRTQSCEIFSL